MTVSLEQAKALVGWSDTDEIVWQVEEFPLGWHFWVVSRKYLETRAIEDALFGWSAQFVIRSTGEVIRASGRANFLGGAKASILQMARRCITLDQSHFDDYIDERIREDPRFLTQEELRRILAGLDR